MSEFATHKSKENEKARKIEEQKEMEWLKKEAEAERLAAEEEEKKQCELEGREWIKKEPSSEKEVVLTPR